MTERFADKLSGYFISRGAAKEDDREVLTFLFFQLISTFQQILALAAVAAMLDAFPQIIAYTFCFVALKRYAGGAHADRHWVCLVVSTGLAAAVCLLYKLAALPPYAAIGAAVVTLALVLMRAPVVHPNNPMSARKQRRMRKTAIAIAAVQCALLAVGCIFWPSITLSGALGGLAAAITLVLPVPAEET